ncbi:MAG: flagellar basal body P-ring formation chaperone FlgA [Deltaproteobacteria bacterium]|jgi:flagella basal body P-ring formation protein FlgA|nr:flagellar basal body P-ring formation chaperone FlgA [Deltaproteobacteria bacterium]
MKNQASLPKENPISKSFNTLSVLEIALKRLRIGRGICFFFIGLFFLGTFPLYAGVTVVFPKENTVSGPRILLGDIANVAPDDDPALASLLEALDLGPSPAPGENLVLRRQQLESRLITSGAPINNVRWVIPETVTLKGRGNTVAANQIQEIVADYLSRTEPYSSGRYEILRISYASLPALPEGEITSRFAPQPSSNPVYLGGTIYFSLNQKEIARVRVTCQINLETEAVVAARDLSRGHVLTLEDLSLSYAPFTSSKGAFTEVSRAVGLTLKVSLRAGTPVRERDLVKTALVYKGETVTIIAQSGGLKVTALGQAKQDGALGETIYVINQDSKKTIPAKVIAPGQVEVVF